MNYNTFVEFVEYQIDILKHFRNVTQIILRHCDPDEHWQNSIVALRYIK